MSSQNQDEIEMVKNELLKAGISAETRCHSGAEGTGVRAVELWVQNERDFFDASKLYERLQKRAPGRPARPATNSKVQAVERPVPVDRPNSIPSNSTENNLKDVASRHRAEPRHEELKQARSLLERGLEEMFLREAELMAQCASLRNKVEELSQALAQGQADLARELESRAIAEMNQTEQVSGLVNTLERERQEWQQQIRRRDDSLKSAQEKLESMSRLLQTQQAGALALKEEIAALEIQREEHDRSLSKARSEALAEREARIAAEEQAQEASLAQESLQKQLINHRDLQQQVQAHLATLGSLFCTTGPKGVAISAMPTSGPRV
jgi:hypothetical protein